MDGYIWGRVGRLVRFTNSSVTLFNTSMQKSYIRHGSFFVTGGAGSTEC